MEFSDVWTNTDFVNVVEDEWMPIPIKDGWEDGLSDVGITKEIRNEHQNAVLLKAHGIAPTESCTACSKGSARLSMVGGIRNCRKGSARMRIPPCPFLMHHRH
jgi:hypothetical protein